ncbi:hypothetical protein G3N95_12075 [Paraburkholderia sp. Tr-20389]|uniref:hypothetical protein n=1 Tax=Paraburkholderia sp. Tr-20389 TaxID=2703903 RepID=UPI00197E4624|nr:hypothetical protein [Paraburkholderia sp. Tr-20389]MBN3753679.1 hypothetical protein [Paraburkholderia sp. Tr-20389]
MSSRDRRAAVITSDHYNGIDFVEIADAAQTTLKVHFLNEVAVKGTLTSAPSITGGETIPSVAVLPVSDTDWSNADGHVSLTLHTAAPGDFSTYTLTLSSPVLDNFYDSVPFSFKAGCPSDLDCENAAPPCPAVPADAPPIDYLAKDFLSFRQALLDFSALRYPNWQERSEADFGVMFLEALSALGDDLSYTQDRVFAEASLDTATQRASVVRHARLVDYQPQPALAATVMLQVDVDSACTELPYGFAAYASDPAGNRVVFETGPSLAARRVADDSATLLIQPPNQPVNALWNRGRINPYWFDDSRVCLPAGATSMMVLGHGFGFIAGQALLIETAPLTPADPPVRQIVHLLPANSPAGPFAEAIFDDVFLTDPQTNLLPGAGAAPASPAAGPQPTPVTILRWQSNDALSQARDLSKTCVVGNLLAATQGETCADETFVARTDGLPVFGMTVTTVRDGPYPSAAQSVDETPEAPPIHLYTLRNGSLAWLAQPGCADTGIGAGAGQPFNTPASPEIVVSSATTATEHPVWNWRASLLDGGNFDLSFTLDDARYSKLVRNSDGTDQFDYDGDASSTLRFGDGVFGLIPPDGTTFTVTYRVTRGTGGNVSADTITRFDPVRFAGVQGVTNPLAASGGADAQSLDSVRRLAPAAFRAVQFRAVKPDDYAAAAQTLPWVQRAGCVFRWTGSWLTAFTTPDPHNSDDITVDERTALVALLNRYRMAGYESYVPDPRYVSIDLLIEICAQASAFRADVERRLGEALSTNGGFFAFDKFSFGAPLERSRLEAVLQSVPGVAGVLCIEARVRGRSFVFLPMPDEITVAVDEIIRCDNDPSRPERGAIKLSVMGGK